MSLLSPSLVWQVLLFRVKAKSEVIAIHYFLVNHGSQEKVMCVQAEVGRVKVGATT